ncbi:TetR family transcriptional regulator C-terminal domain-containing protein [Idiomarina sp. Sol25]|uniref:TetR family transcriptional regulator C-terminal domain-containing protein n=1 Tax=Idiomarina sp. Sol25 TaxID=3064000 RepID=UPI00294B2290|nr:TetR family transcriptional regulator C-terminal domain-containing protein [Idiomarina sp. Sol25]MDV6326797.1 TetR family transcriptional regulator C-terminal domain-containing protein [Idiomarina sp. Sol25]
MTKNDTRQNIITIGADLISIHGFVSTGLNKILSEAQVPKGSFYHYFKSKNDFGLAVIETYAEDYEARMDETLANEKLEPVDRLRSYLRRSVEDLKSCDFSKGCLIGNLGQEMASQSDLFRERLDGIFSDWEQRIARCLKAAQDAQQIQQCIDTAQMGAFILSGWQGALLRAKVQRSMLPLLRFEDMILKQLGAVDQ